MKITHELRMRGDRANLERLIPRVEARLRDGWQRDRESEERRRQIGLPGTLAYCFACTAKGDRPPAAFWVHPCGWNEWCISHVIPASKQRLTEEQAKRVLAEFDQEFLAPAAAEVGVETELVQRQWTVEQQLSPEAFRLLRAFSSSANRAHLERKDRRAWHAFLVRVHQDESVFDPALLDEWLLLEGWPEDTRRQIMGEFETARSLLLAYDEEAERR